MDHIPRLSEVLYVGLCREIGTPTEVAIRRDVKEVEDMIEKTRPTFEKNACKARKMLSGSYREGFRFDTSDRDYMVWYCNCLVINDISKLRAYNSSKYDILLMKETDTPPGFVRLQLLTPIRSKVFGESVIPFNGRNYVSSFLWRQVWFKDHSQRYQNATHHGPCFSSIIGSASLDRAVCLTSKYWPRSTKQHWTERCLRHIWPPASVLKDILNNDCHCMAIGSKCMTSENELEWRVSFSLAEQKLVYTMNHTQFVCYGLLKIFLTEVINKNVEEPLLCSYFMKTTMFWLIQIGHANWSRNNLLKCFWVCFKYLFLCVYRGEFANFFIPQNNMFLNKIVGVARESLLEQLNQYYRIGVACLLHSPTLRDILMPALSRPSFVIPYTDEQSIDVNCQCCINILLKWEVSALHRIDFTDWFFYLKYVDTLVHFSLSPYHLLTLQHYKANFLILSAFMIFNNATHFKHKYMYYLDRNLCSMLKLSSRMGTISHSLYLALYYYRTGRYSKALYVTYLTKQRLSKPYILYHDHTEGHRFGNDISYLSLSREMNNSWVEEIQLYCAVHYIEELALEKDVQVNEDFILLSPFVLVEMLSVLSNYRLDNRSQYLESLTDLHTLLLYDDGRYVPLSLRDISWYILGICQQVVGDNDRALDSYQQSLRQEQVSEIQNAVKLRIYYLEQRLVRNIQM